MVSVETVTNRKPLQWSQTGTEGVGQPWKTHIRTSELSQAGHLVLQVPLAASVSPEQPRTRKRLRCLWDRIIEGRGEGRARGRAAGTGSRPPPEDVGSSTFCHCLRQHRLLLRPFLPSWLLCLGGCESWWEAAGVHALPGCPPRQDPGPMNETLPDLAGQRSGAMGDGHFHQHLAVTCGV